MIMTSNHIKFTSSKGSILSSLISLTPGMSSKNVSNMSSFLGISNILSNWLSTSFKTVFSSESFSVLIPYISSNTLVSSNVELISSSSNVTSVCFLFSYLLSRLNSVLISYIKDLKFIRIF